jgi:predicted nucleic acid-binding protein
MIFELHKNGFDLDVLVKILESVQTKVNFETCTNQIHQKAIYLESLCDSLHCGDSDILAIAYENKFDLISCDKGLVNAAKQFNVKNVNPDMVTSNVDTRRSRIPYFATVKKVIQEKKKQVINNTSTILKPGQKIIWSLTT